MRKLKGFFSKDERVTVEPTYCSEGIMTYTCTKCSKTKTEKIPKIDLPDSKEVEHQQICWKCGHDDGTVRVTIHRGEVIDASWTCSSCSTYNQHTYEMN